MGKKRKLSLISTLHYWKLVFRSLLFLAALGLYIYHWVQDSTLAFGPVQEQNGVLSVIWMVFIVEMILRFFPSRLESMGCQKQFLRNYKPNGKLQGRVDLGSWKSTLAVALAWFALNGAIGAMYYVGWIDQGILLLISLAYSICDMICILFFCPFQTWFMKNKCCGSCRIYNWDYAMMFTPLVFIRSFYTWSLLGVALLLLLAWELAVYRHPERFSEKTNCALACANCPEKLCHHKKQLQRFLKKYRKLIQS